MGVHMKYRFFLVVAVVFLSQVVLAQTVAEMITNLNRHAGNVRALGSQTISSGMPVNPRLNSALQLVRQPGIVTEIQRLEGRLHSAARVLANPQSSGNAQRLASERMARVGPRLINLMEARAGLVRALNSSLRTSVAQTQGVRPYVSTQGGWLTTTLQIIREFRGNTPQTSNPRGGPNARLARGLRLAFTNNARSIRSYFGPAAAGARPNAPREIPSIIVSPAGNATTN